MQDQEEVVHETDKHRFTLHPRGREAELVYRRAGNTIAFLHTGVPPELQGLGIASKLAKAALDYARSENLRVRPLCPSVADFIQRHAKYQDLVV